MNNQNAPKIKWYQHKGFTAYAILSVALSVLLFQQNCHIQRENSEIKHRLDVKDAYFNKGLIEGAKEREAAYFEIKNHAEKILAHCKTHPCKLSPELSVLPADRRFEPMEKLLMKDDQ